jgi:hypothetical protein
MITVVLDGLFGAPAWSPTSGAGDAGDPDRDDRRSTPHRP